MKTRFLFFIFFVLANLTLGQNRVDSLKQELKAVKADTAKVYLYNQLSREYQYLDTEIGIRYAQKGLKLSEKIKWKEGIADSYICFGINNIVAGEPDKALRFFKSALRFSKSKKSLSRIYSNMAVVYNGKADFTKALDYAFKSVKICEEIKDFKQLARGYNNIASVYYYLERIEQSIVYYKKALAINEQLNNKKGIGVNLQNIGAAYYLLDKDDLALNCYSKALVIGKEINDKESVLYNHLKIAEITTVRQEFDNAAQNIAQAKKIAAEIKNEKFLPTIYLTEGELYKSLYSKTKSRTDLNKAISALGQAIHLTEDSNDFQLLSVCYKALAQCHEWANHFKEASAYYKLYAEAQDTVYNTENKETIKNLEDKRAIELRDKQLKINKLSLEAKEKQKWYLIGGILSLFIIGSMLYYQSRSRKKTTQKLMVLNHELDQANKTKARFFSILNHDLREPVSKLIHFLHLKKESPELLDEESKKRMEIKTIAGAENLLKSMEDILLWSKGQMERFKPQLKKITVNSVFEDTQKHFLSEEKVQIVFKNPDSIVLQTDEDYLKTIIRNLTGNALKALETTENPVIVWKAYQHNKQTFLSVTDNGPGASSEQFRALYDEKEVVGIKTGLGLHLIRDLAKAIDCSISVNSQPSGTTITLQFT